MTPRSPGGGRRRGTAPPCPSRPAGSPPAPPHVGGRLRYLPFTRARLRFWLVLAGCVAGRATGGSLAASWGLLVPGMGLHLWARGHLRLTGELIRSGPYRLVRHPFYLANALIDLGLLVAAGAPVLAPIYALLWIHAYRKQIRFEEAHLLEAHGEAYRRYRREVPLLLPWKGPRPVRAEGGGGGGRGQGRGPGFSWSNPQIARGIEIPRLLRVASYPLLLFGVSRAGAPPGGGILSGSPSGAALAALGGFAFLEVAAALLRLLLKSRRGAPPSPEGGRGPGPGPPPA